MPCEGKNASVLVLDPHRPSRHILLRYLHQFGLGGTEAACIKDAKALFRRGSYRAVALQCPLPDAAFVDVMGWLRPFPPLDRRLYVLAITSMPEVFSREVLLQEGVDDYLVKPASSDDVSQALIRMQSVLNQ